MLSCRSLLSLLSAGLLACLSACADDPAPSGASPDAGAPVPISDGGEPVSDGGGGQVIDAADGSSASACVGAPRPDVEANVTPTAASGKTPLPTGGPIIDGTYRLTALLLYSGAQSTLTERALLVFDGTTFTQSGAASNFTTNVEIHSYTVDTAMNEIVLDGCVCRTLNGTSADCVAQNGARLAYSASSSEIHFVSSGGNGGFESVYVRQ